MNTGDLHTESKSVIDGPNGAGSVETVSVNINGASRVAAAFGDQPVTQGELIRQEQEAGITPVPTVRPARTALDAGANEADGEFKKDDEEEHVHARGPNMIGMEDLGPQAAESGLSQGIAIASEEASRGDDGDGPAAGAAGDGPAEIDDVQLPDADQSITEEKSGPEDGGTKES